MDEVKKAEDVLQRPIEQVAIFVRDDPGRVIGLLSMMGLTEWTHDRVRARGIVYGAQAENFAALAFNYQLGPFEFEVLSYLSGDHWIRHRAPYSTGPELSHLGYHVENADDEVDRLMSLLPAVSIAQDVQTFEHESEYLRSIGRTYRYVVLHSRNSIGFDLKLIQRLDGGTPG